MERAFLYGPRDLRVESFSLDTEHLEPDQLWVETEVSALSTGTDRGNYEGAERVPGAPPYPRYVGYSNVGRVKAVGGAVDRFKVGDRVFATRPHQAAYVASQTDMIVRVPDEVSSEAAGCTHLYHLA